MFEIFYKAKFCGGPLDGFVETQRAVNGILLDAIGRSYPGESGFEFARYVRDGFPDSEAVVRYNWDTREANHDAVPAAIAEDVLKEPTGRSGGEPAGEPEGTVRTGNTLK